MNYIVRIPQFEGPFDLLLDLVDRQRIPITEIKIAQIAEDYLDAIRKLRDLDIALAGDFIRMASTLLHLKSKSLLPSARDEELGYLFEEPMDDGMDYVFDSEDELKSRLLAFRVYRDAAARLAGYEAARRACLQRTESPTVIHRFEPMGREEFLRIVAEILPQLVQKPEEVRTIYLDEISVEEKMDFILDWLAEGDRLSRFSALLEKRENRAEVVATFLAILELTRLCRIKLKQKKLFDDIEIQLEVAA